MSSAITPAIAPPARSLIAARVPASLLGPLPPLLDAALRCLSQVPDPDAAHRYLLEARSAWTPVFEHALSGHLLPTAPPADASRSCYEAGALLRHRASLDRARAAADAVEMREALLALARTLEPTATGPRHRAMRLRARQGYPIPMPAPTAAAEAFDAIAASLAAPPTMHVLARAAWHHVRLLNAHTLPDGNGRLARAVFNLELGWAGMPQTAYVPLYSIMGLARGGFEVRLREAELLDRWLPVTEFLAQAVLAASHAGLPAL